MKDLHFFLNLPILDMAYNNAAYGQCILHISEACLIIVHLFGICQCTIRSIMIDRELLLPQRSYHKWKYGKSMES